MKFKEGGYDLTNLTQKELLLIQDQLSLEKNIQKFTSFAAGQCTDAGAKNLLQRISTDHQRSYQAIARHLGKGQVQ